MNFQFNDDQLLFAQAVRNVLSKECVPEHLRALEQSGETHSDERWQKLVELGLPGIMLSHDQGGMGFSAIDFILIAEECGYAALPENLVELAGVTLPLCSDQDRINAVLSGDEVTGLSHPSNPFVVNANDADNFAMIEGNGLYIVDKINVQREDQNSIDPLRKLSIITCDQKNDVCEVNRAQARAFEHGALFSAAQLIGLSRAMLDMTVQYAKDRTQFGQPIGGFQAVKHQLADVRLKIEFASPVVYKAAADLSDDVYNCELIVSQAKLAATQTALQAAKTAIQIHGAMGYTYEVDLHFWMKRAWALAGQWGSQNFHESRVAAFVFDGATDLRAHQTFQ